MRVVYSWPSRSDGLPLHDCISIPRQQEELFRIRGITDSHDVISRNAQIRQPLRGMFAAAVDGMGHFRPGRAAALPANGLVGADGLLATHNASRGFATRAIDGQNEVAVKV